MDSTQPPVYPIDYPHSSSMSEADSLSDSDWLDISSSKESDDNDSVSSRASDRDEVDYGPPSRRSSISIGSSRDGDVEAWEGFAEDSADELVAHDDLVGLSIPPTLPPALRSAVPLDETLTVPKDVVHERDAMVVLDQNTMGTLSASRSSSSGGHASTTQNSTRDLRLSFPDPLTSSQDELKSSYEGNSSSETMPEGDVAPPASTRAVDPGPSATPEVLNIVVSKGRLAVLIPDLEIVLYGNTTPSRWSVVDSILEKAANGAGLTVTPPPKTSEEYSRLLQIDGHREAVKSFPKSIAVIDRTSDTLSYYPVGPNLVPSLNSATMTWRPEKHGRFQGARPSLAIIFLPSMSSVSITHTSYLPVLVPSGNISASSIEGDESRKNAESWSKGSIGPDAIFTVKQDGKSVIDINDVANLQASHVHDALGRLIARADDARRRRTESLKEAQIMRDNDISHFFRTAVTGYAALFVQLTMLTLHTRGFLAFMAILLVRLCVPAKQLPTPVKQASNTSQGCILPGDCILPVASKSSSPVAPNDAAVIPSSLKDFALAVFNPAPYSAAASSTASPAKHGRPIGGANTQTKGKEPEDGDGKLMTWSERVKSSKELILTGSSSVSFEVRSKKAQSLIASKDANIQTEDTPPSFSIRLVNSLPQIFDVKALSEVVLHDMKELSDALDQLIIAIAQQTTTIVKKSKCTRKILRERLEQRHGKAKVRARQLKDIGGQLGGQLLTFVGGEIKSRTDQAKGKAREMAETLVLSEAWTVHRKRVEGHRRRMEASSIDRQKRREARRARRQARRSNNEGCAIFCRA